MRLSRLNSLLPALVFSLFASTVAVSQVPYGYRFVSTREAALNVLYDGFHQRFYVTVPGENAVYVVSEADGSVAQKITIPSAFALDLSVDGTRLYVTSSVTILGHGAAQGYFVVDTATLHVVDFVQPTIDLPSLSYIPSDADEIMPRFIAALSNGKIAYVADHTGVTGAAIFENDPATNLATNLWYAGFYSGAISKSLDGSGFVAVSADTAGEAIAVFDTASDSYIATQYLSSTNNSDVIMSPDGSEVLAGGHLLLDRHLSQIADLSTSQATSSFAWSSGGSTFSNDGSRIYVVSTLTATVTNSGGGSASYSNPVISVYNASSHQLLGYVPLPANIGANTVQSIAVGNSGKALLTSSAGFLELNASSPQLNLPAAVSQSLRTPNTTVPGAGTPASPAATTVNGGGFRAGATVFFGSQQANATLASPQVINVQPPSAAPGLASVTVGFPDGWAILAPNAYSYGPVITTQDVTAGDVNGGAIVTLTGYGFDVSSGYPQITVGGRSATVTAFGNTLGPQSVTFTVPSGAIGSADIALTSEYGTATIKNGFLYLEEQRIGSILPIQMVVDNARNQLYVADGATGSVLDVDAATLAVRTLFSSTNPATGLAITPDGSKLLVSSYSGCTLDVIDLTTGNHLKTIIPTPANIPGSMAPNKVVATSRGTAILSLEDTSKYLQGAINEVDLTTGATYPVKLGNGLAIGTPSSTLLAASADGNRVYLATDGGLLFDGGGLDLWQAANDSSVKEIGFTGGVSQLATTDTGDRVLGDSYTYDTLLRQLTTPAPVSALISGRYLVLGEKLHSSGSLVYMPTSKGVEIYDVHTGATLLSIGSPAGSLNTYDNLAINHAGDRLYLAQQNGVAVIDLPGAPLSIGSLTPAQGDAAGGTSVVLRGSGFVSGTTVAIDGKPATVQFIDSTRLILTTPAVTPAKDIVAVKNPDGTVYSLDAAFDASPVIVPGPPTLTSLSPSYINAYSSPLGETINGSGFTPSAVVSVNGLPVDTTYINSNRLMANIYTLGGPGNTAITVTNQPNPTPSNIVYITTYLDGAYIFTPSPSSVPAGSGDFAMTLVGSSIAPTSIAMWNGVALPTTFVNRTTLIAKVPASDVAAVGTAAITVYTPQATPVSSNTQTFTITPSIAAATAGTSFLNFAPILLGDSITSSLTINSSGQLPLTITGVTLSDTTDFSQTSNCTAAPIPAGQSCTIQVTFKPTPAASLGPLPGVTLSLVSNAATAMTPVHLNAATGDLRFSPAPLSATVVAGHSTTIPVVFNVYGTDPPGTIQFACSGGVPSGATCSFNPNVLPLAGSGTANLTIATSGGSASVVPLLAHRGMETFAATLVFCLCGFRRRRLMRAILLAFISTTLLIGLNACSAGGAGGGSGGSGSGTPVGSYTVTLSAISGGVTKTTAVALTVSH